MRKYIEKEKFKLTASVLLGAFAAWLLLESTKYMGNIMDIATGSVEGNLIISACISLGLNFLMEIFNFISQYLLYMFADKVSVDIRVDLIRKYYLSRSHLFLKKSFDSYFNTLDEDIDYIRVNYLYNLSNFLISAVSALVCIIIILTINYFMLIGGLIFSLIAIFTGKIVSKPLMKAQQQRSESNEEYVAKLREIIDAYETIKTSNKYKNFISSFKEALNYRTRMIRKLNIINFLGLRGVFITSTLGFVIMVYIGSILIERGEMTPGLLLASIFIINNLGDFVRNSVEYLVQFLSCKGLIKRVEEDLKDLDANETASLSCSLPIKLENVSFSFKDKNLFKDINMEIKEGDLIAILGYSGSGKSTLAKLLIKYNDDYEGSIYLGDNELRNINEFEVNELINYIPQNPYILRASLFENISMYKDGLSPESKEYMDIIKKVNLEDVYRRCSELKILDRTKLSGGEKQRIALARALINNRKLIIFDEPTTGLDPENAKMIDDIIFNLKGIARVVITHNWNEDYLSHFDKVIKI